MSLRSALMYSFSGRYLSLVMQFVTSVIVARLVTPEEMGVFSVGAAVIMIAHTLRDFGTSNYVIQEPELTDDRIRAAFTLTALIAWVVAGVLWLAASPLARFYEEAGVESVLHVMAVNFAIIPFGSITLALLRREMKFRSVMFIGIAGNFVQSGASIALVMMGYSYLGLAWAAVLGTAATVLGALIVDPRWVVSMPSLKERKRVLGFGARSSVSSISSEVSHAAPDIVLGKTLGMEATGLFGRAMGYAQLFERLLQDVLRGVMLPYLAGELREGNDLGGKVNHALSIICMVSWFMIGCTAILAEPMIRLLYGPTWIAAVPVAQVLCVVMAIRCISPTLSSAMVAIGRINVVMRISVASSLMRIVLLVLLSPFGLIPAAVGFALAELGTVGILLAATQRAGVFTWKNYFVIAWKGAPIACAGVVPILIGVNIYPAPDSGLDLVIYVTGWLSAAGIVWMAVVWGAGSPLKNELRRVFISIRSKFE